MKNFHPTGNCPVRDVLSRLGDKWSMLVLITLNANGTMRFSDIHKTIGDVSQRMLTVTLRTLESDGLVERKVYAEVPLNSVRGMYPFWPHVPAGESLSANEHAKPAIKDIPILRFSPAHGTAWRRFIIFQCGFSWRLE